MSKPITVDYKFRFSGFLAKPDFNKIVNLLRKSSPIVEKNYSKESPVDTGDLRGDIKSKDIRGGYVTRTEATNNGESYPEDLHRGTGALRGAADYGYTPGRIRSGTVRSGIGGIRPNKFADRARESSEPEIKRFMNNNLRTIL